MMLFVADALISTNFELNELFVNKEFIIKAMHNDDDDDNDDDFAYCY